MSGPPLTLEERYLIQTALLSGMKGRQIGRELRRHHSTIYDEIERGRDGASAYCPHIGQMKREKASERSAANVRCKPEKLWCEVERRLAEGWSPEAISGRWKHLGKKSISVPALYAGAKRRDWQGYFHRQRIRAHLKRPARRKWPGTAQSIHQRSEDANLRIESGHWEADTATGKKKDRKRLLVMVERKSLYWELALLDGTASEPTAKVMRRRLNASGLPFKTVTTDRGAEFTATGRILGKKALVCDAYSPNQRATNENQIGVLRADLPKGVSMDHLTPKQVKRLQDKHNHRPRKSLGFLTPYEAAFGKAPSGRR